MPDRSPRLLAVALALLLALSGCTGSMVEVPSPIAIDEDEGSTTTAMGESSASPTQSETTSATATAAPDRPNPWGSDPIVVAVRDTAGTDREWTPLVEEATAYWEANAERFAGYAVDYDVRPTASTPDLVIEFVDEIPECDRSSDAAGCAPLIEDSRQIDRPETVYIRTGFSDDSTVQVIEHELGHTLGLTHDDAPADIMASRSVLYTEAQPNATERAFPWADADFTVYVDAENASDPAGLRNQVEHTLTYYENGPEGMPTNLTFTMVDRPEDAEIVIRPVEASPCGSNAASCGATAGEDRDGDGAIEVYSQLRIALVDLDTDATGWHTGYWLAYGFGAEADEEKPPPFRDASYREIRSDWWE